MNGIFLAFLGGLITFSVTTLGAAGIFCVKKQISDKWQNGFLGFAGGVMIAASVWSLLLPGIDFAEENGQIGWLVITVGFVLGVIILLLADFFLHKWYKKQREKPVTLRQSTSMLVLAITVHNIPEGMSVGLAFALAAQNKENIALMSGAIALTIGIAIQNFPEGTAVSLPLMKEGMSKKKAFLIGSMTGIVEPIFSVLAATFASMTKSSIAIFLAFAAGAMIYVVVEELIPEAHMDTNSKEGKEGTIGFIVGFLVMMILDVALG
ncbi:ZIP family metal transporter [Faecalimonas sp.]